MIYYFKIILIILFIIYHTEIVFAPFPKAVFDCADTIYNELGYNKKDTSECQLKIGKHVLLNKVGCKLESQDTIDYFNYLKDQITVDKKLLHPETYCDNVGKDIYKMVGSENIDIALREIKNCQLSVFIYFFRANDMLENVQNAFEYLDVSLFEKMLDTDYAKMYFNTLVECTIFNENLLTPAKYCQIKYKKNNRNIDNDEKSDETDKYTEDDAVKNTKDRAVKNKKDRAIKNRKVDAFKNTRDRAVKNTKDEAAKNTRDRGAKNTRERAVKNIEDEAVKNTKGRAVKITEVEAVKNTRDRAVKNTTPNRSYTKDKGKKIKTVSTRRLYIQTAGSSSED